MKPGLVLTKHFFMGLIQNDSLAQEDRRRENLIFYLAFLVFFGAFFAHKLFFPYLLFSALTGLSHETIWLEKSYFITMTMALVGIVSVMSWDNLFLDRKDFTNLFVLPLARSKIYLAKFLSISLYIGLISMAVNILAMAIINIYIADKVGGDLFLQTGGLLFSNLLAHTFVFLFVALVQVVVMVLFRGSLYQKAVTLTQNLLLMFFVSTFAWFPVVYPKLTALKNSQSLFFKIFPPLWFTGFSEILMGTNESIFENHHLWVMSSIGLLVLVYLAAIPLSLSSFKKMTAGSGNSSGNFSKWLGFLFPKNWKTFPVHPVQKGIFHFVISAFQRDRRHKLLLASFLVIPFGLVAADLVIMGSKKGLSFLTQPGFIINSIPLLLFICLAMGLRSGVRHAVVHEANWIFKTLPLYEYKQVFYGMKKAMIFGFFMPLSLLLTAIFCYSWGITRGILHQGYSLAIALVVLELLFLYYKKIPFTYEFSPAPMTDKMIWGVAAIGFLVIFAAFIEIGGILIIYPVYYWYFFPLAAIILSALKLYRGKIEGNMAFHFEEIKEPVFLTLGLDRF